MAQQHKNKRYRERRRAQAEQQQQQGRDPVVRAIEEGYATRKRVAAQPLSAAVLNPYAEAEPARAAGWRRGYTRAVLDEQQAPPERDRAADKRALLKGDDPVAQLYARDQLTEEQEQTARRFEALFRARQAAGPVLMQLWREYLADGGDGDDEAPLDGEALTEDDYALLNLKFRRADAALGEEAQNSEHGRRLADEVRNTVLYYRLPDWFRRRILGIGQPRPSDLADRAALLAGLDALGRHFERDRRRDRRKAATPSGASSRSSAICCGG